MPESYSLPTSKLKRSAITSITAAKVGLKHVGHKTRSYWLSENERELSQAEHEEKLGKLIFSALSQLRGTALKVSQLLSMEADILPASIREQLKNACYQVPPINRALVRKQVVQELGSPPAELFKGFNPQAFAAASIGQVHRAVTTNNQLVAVKIQYPGIGATIESDLKLVEHLFKTLSKVSNLMPQKQVRNLILKEMQDRLKDEIDYEIEADNLSWFKQNTNLANIVIPDVLHEYSAKRVITFEMLDGLHLDDWLATNPDQQQRNHFGQLLFDFFWYSVFQLKRINADPHPGNFLFQSNGNLGVIDFGCVRSLDEEFIESFSAMIPAVVDTFYHDQKSDALFEIYRKLKFIGDNVTLEQFEQEIRPLLVPFALWFGEAYQQETFDFKNKSPCPGRPNSENNVAIKYLNGMYSEQLCFDRAHLGLMNLLTQLGAEIKTDWQKFRN
ncbi:ABC1 kinase family protein [Aliikangiella coralliicola]|nr:AarF/ABC1/UbiB kinase family protein [Aliikangiella coralliicola]